jgi:hypothetical protein
LPKFLLVIGQTMVKAFILSADNECMEWYENGSWYVKKLIGQVFNIIGSDSSVVAVVPEGTNGNSSRLKDAYLIAAAPQLFTACCKVREILENSLIVTREGFQIDSSEIRGILLDATLRASGCRKAPEEP